MRKIITIMLRVLPFVKSFATTRRNPSVSICQRAVAYTRTLRSRLFSSASLKLDDSKTRLISFVTDIEGDGLYFDRFVNNSTILDFEEVEPNLCPHAHDYFPYEKRVVFLPTSDDNEKILESEAKTVFNTDGIHMTTSILVCGGDMWDKGGNDLYVLRQMLSLQERYEGRVHFVMGNRDINKMRVLQELGITSKSSAQSLPLHGGVYWFKDTGLQGDPELIRKHLRMDKDGIQDDGDSYSILVPNSPPERLRWILKKSMGSPDAFEFRRNELKQEKEFLMSYEARDLAKAKQSQARLPAVVSDVEVVESYRTSCHPKGIMGKYLARSKLCLRIGCAMFMHGSLPITPTVLSTFEENGCNDNFNEKKAESFWSWFYTHTTPFRVKKSSAQGPVSTDEWVNILNAFAKSQFDAWKNSVTLAEEGVFGHSDGKHGEYWSSVGGYQTNDNSTELGIQFGSLCQYGMGWLPDKQQNPTVVYNSWLKDGLPRNLYEKNHDALSYQRLVKDFFNTSGLDVIVTGHQPVGDIPFPIQVETNVEGRNEKKFIVCADTSYSGDSKWMDNGRMNLGRGYSVSGRGDVAVSEVLLEQRTRNESICGITSHGIMSDGSSYESINFQEERGNMIGKLVDRDKLSFEGIVQDDSCDEVEWFVKSKFKDSTYLVSTGKGYEVFNSIATRKT